MTKMQTTVKVNILYGLLMLTCSFNLVTSAPPATASTGPADTATTTGIYKVYYGSTISISILSLEESCSIYYY